MTAGLSAIEAARPDDLAAVLTLLAAATLPDDGVAKHFADFLVARRGAVIVGAVGMERYGESALLRSLVVAPSERDLGLGRALVERLLSQAHAHGARRVFLLTETAGDYFPRFGFRRIAREEVDAPVRQSVEFTTACPASATVMSLEF